MDQLGSDLQLQVQNLVLALRDITKKEREQLLERVNEDCSRVRGDMSQTLSIQHYLASLLAETDPFLLIWVRTCAGHWCERRSTQSVNLISIIEFIKPPPHPPK